MIEYPVLIVSQEGDDFDWDLHNVAEGSYQIRVIRSEDVLQMRNITLRMIFSEDSLSTTIGNFYVSNTNPAEDGRYVQMADILPEQEVLKLLLRVFIYSNPYYADGRDLDFCDINTCASPMPLHEDGGHEECVNCLEPNASQLMETYYVQSSDMGEEMLFLCTECTSSGYTILDIDDIEVCPLCSDFYRDDLLIRVSLVGQSRITLACTNCTEDLYACPDCGIMGNVDEMTRDDDGEVWCDDCFPDNNDQFVESWNYLPELIFHPTFPKNPLKPLYIGMEIEINWDSWKYSEDATIWLEDVQDNHNDIMFVKSDSSVSDGFELVTHPMSPEWALENFPFGVLEDAVEAGADESHPTCGMHIHIDRGALSTAQLWKILKVHEKQRELCGIIGGRGTTSHYASWDNDYECVGEAALEIARAKGEAWGGADRYVPINLKNENTIELRYMEGSIAVSDIKKNIEWVQALYDFTDHISVEDVKKGVLNIPGFLLGWIVDQEKIYPNLTGFVLARTMIPLEMPERSAACV